MKTKKIIALLLVVLGALIYNNTYAAVDRGNWDNTTQWINTGFLAQSPTDSDIIWAMYGSDANKNTVYSTNWNTKTCTPSTMSVVNLNSGSNTIPNNLVANTIYVLAPGKYITTYGINMASCSAILGKGDVGLYNTTQVSTTASDGMILALTKSNIIIQGIKLDGESNGSAGTHTRNINGIRFASNGSSSTFYDLTIQKLKRTLTAPYGVGILVGDNVLVNFYVHAEKLRVEDAVYGFSFASNRNILKNSTFTNFSSAGVSYYIANYNTVDNIETSNANIGIYLYTASYNTGIKINSHNNAYGTFITQSSNNNVIMDSHFYNNTNRGINMQNTSNNNTIINSNAYANGTIGVAIAGNSVNTTVDKLRSYNNADRGMQMGGGCHYTKINNSLIFNNEGGGIYSYQASYTSINNSYLLNNAGYGVNLNGTYNLVNNSVFANQDVAYYIGGYSAADTNVLNNVSFVNNNSAIAGNYSISVYGNLNLINNVSTGYVTLTLQNDGFNGMGFAGGTKTIKTGEYLPLYVDNVLSSNNNLLLDPNDCNIIPKGKNYSRPGAAKAQSYWFGPNTAKQVQPIHHNGTSWVNLPVSRNSANAIGYVDNTYTPTYQGRKCGLISDVYISSEGFTKTTPQSSILLARNKVYKVSFDRTNISDKSYINSVVKRLLPPYSEVKSNATGAVSFSLKFFKPSEKNAWNVQ